MSVARQAQYVHYTGPPTHTHAQQQQTTVSPQDTQHAPPKTTPRAQPAASGSGTGNGGGTGGGSGTTATTTTTAQTPHPQPVVAKGNWTKDLVQLAKTAELKKHALTLQLHTAHILSAHASLEQKNRAVQDIREQRNKLESERTRLIECLSQASSDRNQADLLLTTLSRECAALQAKISTLSEGEYAVAKADVDRLRAELGQPPLPGLQAMMEGKGAGYLAERRTAGSPANLRMNGAVSAGGSSSSIGVDGAVGVDGEASGQAKRPRGRPRGSRNRGAAGG
ncbi:hypothetical protein B0H11DRAFT_1724647 [Mycena galericulata]|nr:hypothetical protein B0H11DRAFT_1724647 [Mycena galericulata]